MRPIPDRLTPLECWPVHMTRQDKTRVHSRLGYLLSYSGLYIGFLNKQQTAFYSQSKKLQSIIIIYHASKVNGSLEKALL